jgi:hypothetical protein
MALFTSNVTFGYWSDPASWLMDGSPATRPPKEGDSVTIQAGHTIVFDADMSGFPNGLSGLTINGTLLIPSLNDPSFQEVGEETSGTPWLSGWSYRRTVYVDNSFSSTSLTNFQIIIRLNTAYLIAQGKMHTDCGDIRVTDSSGNLLPIWIDPDTKNMWNTKIYVKVPSIPANSVVTLYLFYGNPVATDVSDGSSVFDFFDDFSGTTLDTNKWTAARWTGTGSWSVTVRDGYVEINSGSGTRAGIVSKTAFALPFIVEGRWRYVSGDEMWTGITQTNGGSHSDLVEHGYDEQYRSAGDGNIRYYYRKASGGSYSNYQHFSRYAPRESFTRFAIEWLTNAGRYYEWDIQVNSTTTQDRYTSGSCYIQLSTLNCVAQWDWIAVRKYAATPPAVYFRTLTWTALKVNANIAGTGTLQVGSESYAITYPQKAQILVNGTIQTAYFKAYGETRRTWDWFEFDATVNPPRLYLKNGIPLRKGDVLIVYSNDPVPVLDYDPSTRTVVVARSPWNRTGERLGFPRTTLLLMTYCIDILRFGSNSSYFAAGTNFIFVGTFLTRLPLFIPSANSSGGNLTNPTFRYCGNYRMTAYDYNGHWVAAGGGTGYWQWCVLESGTSAWGWAGNGWSSSSSSTIEDCCIHNPRWGMSIQGLNTYLRCYQQGGPNGFGYITPQAGSTWDGCVFMDSGGNSHSNIIARNCKLINASGLGGSYNLYENIVFYNDNGNRTYLGGTRNLFRNIEIHLNSTHWNILLGGARQCRVHNVTIYSYANAPFLSISNDVWVDNIIEGLSVSGNCHVRLMGDPSSDYNASFGMQMLGRFANLSVPILSGNYGNIPGGGIVYHPAGYWNVEQLTVGSIYNRAAVHNTKWDARFGSLTRLVSSVRISGLTVGTTQYPNALEFIGFNGWAKNRWDAAQPDYQTFDFYMNPTVVGYYGTASMGPIIAWWVFQGLGPIYMAGTITQIGANETVAVEIYRYGKEPLLYDTPEFRREFTQVGSFEITWTPPDAGIWVARILARLWQTTNPITITGLQVMSLGGSGGGGGGGGDIVNIQVSDQMGVLAGETIQAQLAIQQAINAAISGFEQVNPSITTTVDDTAVLQSVDSVIAQFSLLPSELVQVLASEAIQSSLQTSVSDVMQVLAQDSVLSQVFASPSEAVQVAVSESILPSIAIAASDLTQVQTNESQTTQIGVSSSEVAQVSAIEQVASSISFALIENQQVLASEDTDVFTGFQLLVSDSVHVTTSESQSTNIAAQIVEQEAIRASEALTTQLGVSVADSASVSSAESVVPTLQPRVSETVQVAASESQSVSIAINFTQQESVRASEALSTQIGIVVADQATAVASEIASQTIIPQISETMRISASEQPSVAVQVSAATTAQVRTTESVSPSVQLAASETGQVLATESSSVQIAGLISETIRVSTSEQTSTQVQFSAVESVTQIEAETAPFVGLIQRLMIPVSVDLLKAVELSISITQVSLDLGID